MNISFTAHNAELQSSGNLDVTSSSSYPRELLKLGFPPLNLPITASEVHRRLLVSQLLPVS